MIETPPRQALPGGVLAAGVACLMMVVGSVGPWATIGIIHANGLDNGRDGWVTLVCGLLAALLLYYIHTSQGSPLLLGLLGVAGAITAIVDGKDISDRHATLFGADISPQLGWGLIIAGIGSGILVFAAVNLAGMQKRARQADQAAGAPGVNDEAPAQGEG